MTHLYLMTRGAKDDVDKFVRDLQSKYCEHDIRDHKDLSKPIEKRIVSVVMRPLQMWEVIVPKGSRDKLLTTLWPKGSREVDGIKTGHFGNLASVKFQKVLPILRRILGKDVYKIPEDYNKETWLPCWVQNIEFMGIGLKEDDIVNGVEML